MYLTPESLARRWHISPITLKQWRWKGLDPPYLKLTRRIIYRLEDIEAYEKKNVRQHTTEQTKRRR